MAADAGVDEGSPSMNGLSALLIVVAGNAALFAGLVLLVRVVSVVCRRR